MPYYVANNPRANRLHQMILPPQPLPSLRPPEVPFVDTCPTTQEAAILALVPNNPYPYPGFISPFPSRVVSFPSVLERQRAKDRARNRSTSAERRIRERCEKKYGKRRPSRSRRLRSPSPPVDPSRGSSNEPLPSSVEPPSRPLLAPESLTAEEELAFHDLLMPPILLGT